MRGAGLQTRTQLLQVPGPSSSAVLTPASGPWAKDGSHALPPDLDPRALRGLCVPLLCAIVPGFASPETAESQSVTL